MPRNETLIVENPEGTIKNAGWFNIWAVNAGGQSTGLHQLAMDTFWYIDPDHGLDGVWDNSLASEPPIYNDDFTEMTVKLRPGIFWSDGVEFTADDVVFTTETHLKTNGLVRSAQYPAQRREHLGARQEHGRLQAEEAELALPCAVHGALERGLDDAQAHLRGSGSADSSTSIRRSRSAPTRCTATIRTGSGSPGRSATTGSAPRSAASASPDRSYVTYLDPGPPDKRVIAQLNHDLDIIHDTSPEGVFTLVKESPKSKGWFPGFPYGHPDPTLPQVIFNHQNPKFQDRDVRWALALALDIKAISMASYRGAATISAIAVPPTGTAPDYYHKPMQEWLTDFELDTGKQKIKPYDPTVGAADRRHAAAVGGRPDPDRSDEEIGAALRPRLVEAGSDRGGRAARASRLHPPGQRLVHAERRALLDHASWSRARRGR